MDLVTSVGGIVLVAAALSFALGFAVARALGKNTAAASGRLPADDTHACASTEQATEPGSRTVDGPQLIAPQAFGEMGRGARRRRGKKKKGEPGQGAGGGADSGDGGLKPSKSESAAAGAGAGAGAGASRGGGDGGGAGADHGGAVGEGCGAASGSGSGAGSSGLRRGGVSTPNLSSSKVRGRPASILEPRSASKVIHWRRVTGDISQADLRRIAGSFGRIEQIIMLRPKRQALMAMASVAEAEALIAHMQSWPDDCVVRGRTLVPQFSRFAELEYEKNERDEDISCVLLATIRNIPEDRAFTADGIARFFSQYGDVVRVVVFTKNVGIQTLVEMASKDAAVAARLASHGQCMEGERCTLEVQFSRLKELSIRQPSPLSKDYTVTPLSDDEGERGAADAGAESGDESWESSSSTSVTSFMFDGHPRGVSAVAPRPAPFDSSAFPSSSAPGASFPAPNTRVTPPAPGSPHSISAPSGLRWPPGVGGADHLGPSPGLTSRDYLAPSPSAPAFPAATSRPSFPPHAYLPQTPAGSDRSTSAPAPALAKSHSSGSFSLGPVTYTGPPGFESLPQADVLKRAQSERVLPPRAAGPVQGRHDAKGLLPIREVAGDAARTGSPARPRVARNASLPSRLSLVSYTVPSVRRVRVTTPVVRIMGVDEFRVEPDTLFNVVSGFAHVARILYPHAAADEWYVELGSIEQAQLVVRHVRGLPLFSRPLGVDAGPPSLTSLAGATDLGTVTNYSASPLNPFAATALSSELEKRIRPPSESLLVSHLPKTGVTEELLAQHFEQVGGVVTQVHMKSKRRALVTFATLCGAVNALALLNDSAFGGRHLRLSFSPA